MSTIISFLSRSPRFPVLAFSFSLFFFLCLASSEALEQQNPVAQDDQATGFENARRKMVERDLAGRGIRDEQVLRVMRTVPRHLFVPERLRSSAYEDRALPIGSGQTISQPYVVALMTQSLELKGGERVLEIGTGSGYQTAVLAALAADVYSVEIIAALSARAEKILAQMNVRNVRLRVGNGFHGWQEEAPFHAIMVTAAAPEVPPPLWSQLSEGGVLVMPLGREGQAQRLIRARKRAGQQVVEDLTAVIFVPLTGGSEKSHR